MLKDDLLGSFRSDFLTTLPHICFIIFNLTHMLFITPSEDLHIAVRFGLVLSRLNESRCISIYKGCLEAMLKTREMYKQNVVMRATYPENQEALTKIK